jgi:hypothetical protein
MYTQQQFGKQLKEKIRERKPVSEIGSWAHAAYYEYLSQIDLDFGEFLLQLGTMEMGPEFERSYEELNQIADKLIAGEEVKLL